MKGRLTKLEKGMRNLLQDLFVALFMDILFFISFIMLLVSTTFWYVFAVLSGITFAFAIISRINIIINITKSEKNARK